MTTGHETTIDHFETPATPDEPQTAAELPALTAFDRCDAPGCSAQAYVRTQLTTGGQLVFCGHHGHDLAPALRRQGAAIRDDTHLLVQDRVLSLGH